MHFGTPTQHMKNCYTAVLKVCHLHIYSSIPMEDSHHMYLSVAQGHIAFAKLLIPAGTAGSRVDAVARLALWNMGLDYNHGTGHGVGAYLNVHEGPQGVGFRRRENEVVSQCDILCIVRLCCQV